MGSSGNEMILSYNDAVLRRSDLDILSGPHYINDRIIEFYFSYLSSCCSCDDLLLVPPSISFWIANCFDSDSMKEVMDPLNLKSRKIVIFTVNDNEDFSRAEGGVHWSLLAYDRETNAFVHHDSFSKANRRHALRLFGAVKGYLEMSGLASGASFTEGYTPQQPNTYDCGLYVIGIAKVICYWHKEQPKCNERWFSAVKEMQSSSIRSLRNEILLLIKTMMEKENHLQTCNSTDKTKST